MAEVTYEDKQQTKPYDPEKWNAEDANMIKTVINSKLDKEEFEYVQPDSNGLLNI